MKGYVFISHSEQDRGYVDNLAWHLTAGNTASVWFAADVSGGRWDERIDSCAVVMVVMSSAASACPQVQREIDYAAERGKPVLPLLLSGEGFVRFSGIPYEDVRGDRLPEHAWMSGLREQLRRCAAAPMAIGARNAEQVSSIVTHHSGRVRRAVFSPDGTALATIGGDLDDATLRLWDISDPGHHDRLATLTSQDEPSSDTSPIPPGSDYLSSPVFSPDGSLLFAACTDQTVRVWDVTDPRWPVRLVRLKGHTDCVNEVALSMDGRLLASAGDDKTVLMHDVTDPRRAKLVATWNEPNIVTAIALSPDGHQLAMICAGCLQIVDVTDRHRPAQALTSGHFGWVWCAAFSPDGRMLATAGEDMTVRLWDVTDHGAPSCTAVVSGHNGPIRSVVWSPDGHTLASTSLDQTARLWDVTVLSAPKCIADVTNTGPVWSVAFSPDGSTFATAGDDGTVRLWRISTLRD